jgi:hypothetical protein
VVHEMKTPQKRDVMIRPVPPPQRVVEKNERDCSLDETRPCRGLEQTDVIPFDPGGERLQQRRLQQRSDRERNASDAEVAHEAARFLLHRQSQRSESLGQDHRAADEHDDRGDNR